MILRFNFGRLDAARTRMGWSWAALARACQAAGWTTCAPHHLARLYSGMQPRAPHIRALAAALRVEWEDLCDGGDA